MGERGVLAIRKICLVVSTVNGNSLEMIILTNYCKDCKEFAMLFLRPKGGYILESIF
jgi:hypothetical protein